MVAELTDVLVYLGPTLSHEEAKQHLPAAQYLPPATQGDIATAVMARHPRAILLIDGSFSHTLSVWHKEILLAIERGIVVYGSSSMGALRAVETEIFGMVGLGEVFRMFKEGEIFDDDEVAVRHASADAGYRPLSDAMVNIRATLASATEQQVISSTQAAELIAAAKQTYYAERSTRELLSKASRYGWDRATVERLGNFLRYHSRDIKRQDAIDALRYVASALPNLKPNPPNFTLQRSVGFNTLLNNDRRVVWKSQMVGLRSIAEQAILHEPDSLNIVSSALHNALVLMLADILGVTATGDEIQEETQRLEMLDTSGENIDWFESNDLFGGERDGFIQRSAIRRKMRVWLSGRLSIERPTQLILDELRLRGRYKAAKQREAATQRIAADLMLDGRSQDLTDLDINELFREHLAHTAIQIDGRLEQWGVENGFKDKTELILALYRAKRRRDYALKMLRDQLTEKIVDANDENG